MKLWYRLTRGHEKHRNNNSRLLKNSVCTFFLSAGILTIYESLKQFVIPNVSIWESHTITILFGSCVSAIAVFVVSRKHQALVDEIETSKIEADKIAKNKEDFMYTISHEFKTPLNVIYAAVQVIELLFKNEIPDKAKQYIKSIKQNTFRQMKLVNNLLDLTKIESGYIEIFETNTDIVMLTQSIVESVQLYAEQKKVKLVFIPFMKNKVLALDEEKYERILLNLLSNAIKFTPEGKCIYVYINILKEHNYVKIEVIDEGIGISREKQNFIFQRFAQVDNTLTRRAEGTGIGLSLVKQLVSSLGWKISLFSQEGFGSTFTLTIPSKKAQDDIEISVSQLRSESNSMHNVDMELSDIYESSC